MVAAKRYRHKVASLQLPLPVTTSAMPVSVAASTESSECGYGADFNH
jgi:hypothetical protein